ncbi:hypothetical protein Tco_0317697 [Tanacetum coccineum]
MQSRKISSKTPKRSKLDLENKVRQEQALVIQRNKRNAELVQENDLLKVTLSGKEKSIAFLQSEKEKILSEKEKLADSYLDEIVCLKTANKVARDMLQRFNMPTQTIPMLSKKPKKATNDLHKDILGTRNPGLGYMAKRAQPALYDADTLFHPTHHPVRIWDSEEVLVHQVVSMKKMNEKPGHVRPANDFYAKLNALMFVPQKELSGDQAYWLSANEIASQASKSATLWYCPFVHKSRPQSSSGQLRIVNAVFSSIWKLGDQLERLSVVFNPQWKPLARHFAVYDTCPLPRIMEPVVEPLRTYPKSNGHTVADSIGERLKQQPLTSSRQIAVSFLTGYSKGRDSIAHFDICDNFTSPHTLRGDDTFKSILDQNHSQ